MVREYDGCVADVRREVCGALSFVRGALGAAWGVCRVREKQEHVTRGMPDACHTCSTTAAAPASSMGRPSCPGRAGTWPFDTWHDLRVWACARVAPAVLWPQPQQRRGVGQQAVAAAHVGGDGGEGEGGHTGAVFIRGGIWGWGTGVSKRGWAGQGVGGGAVRDLGGGRRARPCGMSEGRGTSRGNVRSS